MAKLLVVDDSLSVRKAMERILGAQGHEVRTAASLAGARGALGGTTPGETPDLVLCDLILPDGDGLEVCGFLAGRPVPVLCISALVGAEVAARVAAAGAVGLLAKPFSAAELTAAVAAWVGPSAPVASAGAVAEAGRLMRRTEELQAGLAQAAGFPGLVFAAVTAPEGRVVVEARGSEALSGGRTAELLQLAARVVGEVRSGMVQHLVLEAPDARLVVDLLDEGEVQVVCVARRVLLGMALLYARRLRSPPSPQLPPPAVRERV